MFDSRKIYVVDLKSTFNFKSVHTHTNAAEERRCIGWQHPILYWEKPILFLWWYATARGTALDCKLRTKIITKLKNISSIFWHNSKVHIVKYYTTEGCIKFIYSEKATKFCEISTLLLTGTTFFFFLNGTPFYIYCLLR